jgi:hypothetical protein
MYVPDDRDIILIHGITSGKRMRLGFFVVVLEKDSFACKLKLCLTTAGDDNVICSN